MKKQTKWCDRFNSLELMSLAMQIQKAVDQMDYVLVGKLLQIQDETVKIVDPKEMMDIITIRLRDLATKLGVE